MLLRNKQVTRQITVKMQVTTSASNRTTIAQRGAVFCSNGVLWFRKKRSQVPHSPKRAWHTLTKLGSRRTTNRLSIFGCKNEIRPVSMAINTLLELSIVQSICSSSRNWFLLQLFRKFLYSFLLLLFLKNEWKITMKKTIISHQYNLLLQTLLNNIFHVLQ